MTSRKPQQQETSAPPKSKRIAEEMMSLDRITHTLDLEPKDDTISVEIKEIQKGFRGLFAKEDLKKGRLIGPFSPISAITSPPLRPGILDTLWPMAIQRDLKTEEMKKTWESLVRELHPRDEGTSLKTKMEKNAFGTGGCRFLYYTVSFVNHSCLPNAFLVADHLLILDDIPRGGEITISYVVEPDPKKRRAWLLNNQGFRCVCSLCSLGENGPTQQESLEILLGSCVMCGQKEHIFRCNGCKAVRYCGKTCQKIDWKNHKRTCEFLRGSRSIPQ